jgi:hypothetical protein
MWPFLDLLRRHLRAARSDVRQPAVAATVDLPYVDERGEPGPDRGDLLGMLVGLDHDGHRAESPRIHWTCSSEEVG